MSKISVRLPEDVLLKVRLRALQDGMTIQDLGAVWFYAYAQGGTVVASTETTVRPRNGLGAAGEPTGGPTVPLEQPAPVAPRPLKEHRADPKDKAAQEHAPKQRTAVKGLCPHRVPVGSYCKRCEETR